MDDLDAYEVLAEVYSLSRKVCDPVEYQFRQQKLLQALAEYILERDTPDDDE